MTFVKAYLGNTPLFLESPPVFVPSPGLPLLKTGQKVSYATGDDGDVEAGRATDFFTLTANNPFGNTNRFTALNGSQTYTNDIVIDWSTYDASTVLGYYIGDVGTNRTWIQAINWANSSMVGFLWRLPNIREIANLIVYEWQEANRALRYPPFYSFPQVFLWSSTTDYTASLSAFRVQLSNGHIQSTPKTNSTSIRTIACRNFSVSGTTLL